MQIRHLLGVLAAEQALIPTGPIADLGYVSYRGVHDDAIGINYFRGIRYAQPPLGDLRWRPPIPIEDVLHTKGQVVGATSPGPECFQLKPTTITADQTRSEDCLVLDVLMPDRPASTPLPVLVMIHGGGYTMGSAGSYPGDALVHASEGKLIYVSIQYRLGIFGFLAGDAIAADGSQNVGLLDQRAALRWIQRHIGRFGGNPERVTIWGSSAGGGSVSLQLMAGGATDSGLFSAAIVEYPWWPPMMNTSTQNDRFQTALRVAYVTSLTGLRSLSSVELQRVNLLAERSSYPSPGYGYGEFFYGPVVDGVFVRDLPSKEFQRGNFQNVPLLVDHSAYEGVKFSNANIISEEDETRDAQYLFPTASASFFDKLYQLYPRERFNSTLFQRQAWFGDFIINCPTTYLSTSEISRSRNLSRTVFKLNFAAGTQLHDAPRDFLNSPTIGWPSADNATLAAIMSKYWISFVLAHDPNFLPNPHTPIWKSYSEHKCTEETLSVADAMDESESKQKVAKHSQTDCEGGDLGPGFMVMQVTTSGLEMVEDEDRLGGRCDFFRSQSDVVRN